MTISEWWTWLTTGHRHAAASTGLAPAIAEGALRAELVEVERCTCGAVRPVVELGRWAMPVEDE